MSIFNAILHKIFPPDHPSVSSVIAPVTSTASAVPDIAVPGSTQPVPSTPSATLQAPRPDAGTEVDVEQVLADKATTNGQALHWQTSIVDLLKLLDLNSDLDSRMDLAKELQYGGDMNDSATMNVWLHREVMNKLASHGGRVPAGMR